MLQHYSTRIRRTAIFAATALAISLPGAASAGIFDKAKKSARANAAKVVKIVREKRPVAKALQNAAQSVPGSELFEMVQELQLTEQLRDTLKLIKQMQADYQTFSGGRFGCEAECKAFRRELKGLFGDFLSLTEEVPVLRKRVNLINNIERLSDLIDYVPPRALYLMWQATGDQIDELRFAAENIRQALIALPPFVEMSDIAAAVQGTGSAVADSAICGWVNKNDKPVIEWLQAELEGLAWGLTTIEGFIPDIEIKGEAGAEAGVAVANGTAAAGAGVKITDPIKIALKVAATVPQAVNQAIKVNTARAKLVCAGAAYASN
jgi:hypothetical protein